MRPTVDVQKVQTLLRELGRRARGPGRIYLTGGASALLEGWRASTVDVDIKLDPEPPGIFEAIASLKNELRLNIELSAPDHFLPSPPDWRERSTFIARWGEVDFFHYDFRAQALAKISRGHARDLSDVAEMIKKGLVDTDGLEDAARQIVPELIRYPSIDADAFLASVKELLAERRGDR